LTCLPVHLRKYGPMSNDPKAAVAAAVKSMKALAAKELVRKEQLEKELGGIKHRMNTVSEALSAAIEAGEDDQALELITTKTQLEGIIAAKQSDVDEADVQMNAALEEIDKLKRSLRELEQEQLRAAVHTPVTPSPFSTRPEDVALANVRQNIAELDAHAELNDDLNGGKLQRDLAKIEEQEKIRRAREQLTALKAARDAKRTGSSPLVPKAETQDDDSDDPDPKRPKRTL
jgi:phage shock protein A